MDWEAFKDDVLATLGDGMETASAGDLSAGDPFYAAIGATWLGTLFGYEVNNYGQDACYVFDTEAEQRAWFAAMEVAIAD